MVTASHNPPGYNGVKIDHLLDGFSLKEGVINEILHC
jgi:phosphomannomutase